MWVQRRQHYILYCLKALTFWYRDIFLSTPAACSLFILLKTPFSLWFFFLLPFKLLPWPQKCFESVNRCVQSYRVVCPCYQKRLFTSPVPAHSHRQLHRDELKVLSDWAGRAAASVQASCTESTPAYVDSFLCLQSHEGCSDPTSSLLIPIPRLRCLLNWSNKTFKIYIAEG